MSASTLSMDLSLYLPLAEGYKTKSASFRSVMNNMLLSDKRFKKVGRGEFTLK